MKVWALVENGKLVMDDSNGQLWIFATKFEAEMRNLIMVGSEMKIVAIDVPFSVPEEGKNPNTPSLSLINPEGEYTTDNVEVVSWRANELKGDASVEELEMILAYLKRKRSDQFENSKDAMQKEKANP